LESEEEHDLDQLIARALNPENLASVGLKFLLENYKEVCTADSIRELFAAIISIATY